MKKILIIVLAVSFLTACKKKDLECSYLYTDSASGLAERATATVCTKCTKKQRKKAEDALTDTSGYTEVSCEEVK